LFLFYIITPIINRYICLF